MFFNHKYQIINYIMSQTIMQVICCIISQNIIQHMP